MTETRSHSHQIEIQAPVDAVWSALTHGEELTRWYVAQAEVERWEGGRYFVSWGAGMDGESRITVWEPNQRLRLAHQPPKEQPEGGPCSKPKLEEPTIEDYRLENKEGQTVLSLVCSRIPATPEWDGYFEGTDAGWDMFLRALKHYVEKHAGTPRASFTIMKPVPLSAADAWEKLVGPEGLNLPADLALGSTFDSTTGLGEAFAGEVLACTAPNELQVTVAPLNDGLLEIGLKTSEQGAFLYLCLGVFGLPAEQSDALENRWREWIDGLLEVTK